MAFMKTSKEVVEKEASGILYILVMEIDGDTVYKIGVTQRKIEERVVEILSSFFKSYRYFPWCRPKRFKNTSNVYGKEAQMHRYFSEYKYTPEMQFGGSTEFFTGIELEDLVEVYEKCIKGVLSSTETYIKKDSNGVHEDETRQPDG